MSADLQRKFKESKDFSQLITGIRERLEKKQPIQKFVHMNISRWLQGEKVELSQEERKEVHARLYIKVMRAVSESKYSSTASPPPQPSISQSIFPDVPKEAPSTPLPASIVNNNSIFPDLDNLSEEVEKPIPSYYSLSSSRVSPSTAPPPPQKPEPPRFLAEMTHHEHRYQSIIFNHGFYLLDREHGQVWFLKAGTSEFIPCVFSSSSSDLLPSPIELSSSDSFHSVVGPSSPPVVHETGFNLPSPEGHPSSPSHSMISLTTQEDTKKIPLPPHHESTSTLQEEVLSRYPYPIAKLYHSYINTKHPRKQLNNLLLLYLQLIKWMAIPLALRFLKDPSLNSSAMYRALSHLQSSRWSDWIILLQEGANFFHNSQEPLIQEIVQSFSKLELQRPIDKCFMYTQHYLDPNGEERVTELPTGPLEAFNLFRNSFVHGFTPTRNEARQYIKTYGPLIEEILEEMSWVTHYPLLYETEDELQGRRLYPLVGLDPEAIFPWPITPDKTSREDSLYFGSAKDIHSFFELSPLVTLGPSDQETSLPHDSEKSIYLYHGYRNGYITYRGIAENECSSREDAIWWKDHLQRKYFPSFPKESISYSLTPITHRWTHHQIQDLYIQQTLFSDLYVPRRRSEQSLQNFLASEKKLFLLHGSHGVGKTTLLAHFTEGCIEQKKPIIWLNGSHLTSYDVLEIVAKIIGISSPNEISPEGLSRHLASELTSQEELIFVIDDLSSHPSMSSLVARLDQVIYAFSKTKRRSQLKFIVSFESKSLLELNQKGAPFPKSSSLMMSFEDLHFHLSSSFHEYELPPFSPYELKKAYRQYHSYINHDGIRLFAPTTGWEDWKKHAESNHLVRHPLLLRLFLNTYCGTKLPSHLSLDKLFTELQKRVIEERNTPQPFPERWKFLQNLLQVFWSNQTNQLSQQQLSEAPNDVVGEILNPHTDSPFIQLINLAVLQESCCHAQSLKFSSDLVFALFLIRYLEENQTKLDKKELSLLNGDNKVSFLLDKTYFFLNHSLFHPKTSEDWFQWVDNNIKEIAPWFEEYLLFTIRIDRKWSQVTKQLIELENQEILQVILNVTNRLSISNNKDHSILLLEQLSEGARSPAIDGAILSQVLYRLAYIKDLQEDTTEALPLFLEAKQSLPLDGNHPLFIAINQRLSILYHRQGKKQKAVQELEEAKQKLLSQKTEHIGLLARITRQQGNLAYRQGNTEEAIALYLQSQEQARKGNNLRGIAASLSNLGTALGSLSKWEEALSHYNQCLRIHRQIGDNHKTAITLNNIGVILKNQNKIEEAKEFFLQAIPIYTNIRQYKREIESRQHLIGITEKQGELQQTISYLKKNISRQKQIRDLVGESESSLHLGYLHQKMDNKKRALFYFRKARKKGKGITPKVHEARASYAIGQLKWLLGKPEQAAKSFQRAVDLLREDNEEQAKLLSLASRRLGAALLACSQFTKAEKALWDALSYAEQTLDDEELTEVLLECCHFNLIQRKITEAKDKLEQIKEIKKRLKSSIFDNTILCLGIRVLVQEKDEEALHQQLEKLIPTISLPENSGEINSSYIAWALFDVAQLLRNEDVSQALSLAQKAHKQVDSHYFPQRKELEEFQDELLDELMGLSH